VAFKDEELKHGEFFPALSPIYAGDSFTLITPCPEDWTHQQDEEQDTYNIISTDILLAHDLLPSIRKEGKQREKEEEIKLHIKTNLNVIANVCRQGSPF